MTHLHPGRPHPAERELVRFMDEELSDLERSRLRKHLDRCAACEARISALMAQASLVSAALAEEAASIVVDPLVRARAREAVRNADRAAIRQTSWRLSTRAAAAIALIVFGALGANPLFAWVREHVVPGARSHETVLTLPATTVVPEVRRGPVVLFEPTMGIFTVTVANPQPVGTIRLQISDVERASAEVSNPGNEAILVLPSGLSVQNSATSLASYTITLPRALRKVSVKIGDRTVATIIPEPDSGTITREIPLALDTSSARP